jgi:DNA polymerase elongation subunit (family B)
MEPRDAYNLYSTTKHITGEADVSPEQRFICDTFYDTEFPSSIKPRIYFLDIETWVKDGKMPSFNHNLSEINAITVFDNYTEMYYSWFLVPPTETEDMSTLEQNILNETKEYGNISIKLFTTPKSLLSSFMQFLKNNCPDIITAWNSKFDLPYLTRKIHDYFDMEGLKLISPFDRYSTKIKQALETGINLEMDTLIPGIDVIDLMALYKKNAETEKPSYALKLIAEDELGETKLVAEDGNSDPSYMYINNFINFCKYNIQDVRLLTLLENKLMLINLAITIRNIVKTDFQDIFFETRTIDNMFIMEAVRRRNSGWNYVLPSKPKFIAKEKYLGAYVKAPIRGLFKWVADLKQLEVLYSNI